MDQLIATEETGVGVDSRQAGTSLPWLMLVYPIRSWLELSTSRSSIVGCISPLLAQWLLIGVAQLFALQAVLELSHNAGLTGASQPPSFLTVAWQLLLLSIGVVFANAIVALALWGLTSLVNIRANYVRLLNLAAYSLLPVVLGHSLGLTVLAIAQPLTRQPEHAIALLIRPFTIGLATFAPISSQPLSLGWVFASYLDVFGMWSLFLVLAGAIYYLRASLRQVVWLGISLVVLLGLVFTGWWQLLQLAAVH